jgi:hypothetical protein
MLEEIVDSWNYYFHHNFSSNESCIDEILTHLIYHLPHLKRVYFLIDEFGYCACGGNLGVG